MGHMEAPTLCSVKMSGWVLESQGIQEVAQVD